MADEVQLVGEAKKFNETPTVIKGGISSKTIIDWKDITNIAQSPHFTITIDGIGPRYTSGLGDSDIFLPVQNISFSYTSFNNMSIPVGVFGDLPFLRNKSVGQISLSLYDNETDDIENCIQGWEQSCFPTATAVGYLSEIAKELVYKSYSVQGKLNVTVRVMVIPSGSYHVTRGYGDNTAKIVNLSLSAVGPIKAEFVKPVWQIKRSGTDIDLVQI